MPRVVEHFPDHKRGGSFAVSAGNTDDAETVARETGFSGGSQRLNVMIGENEGIVARDFIFYTHTIIISRLQE